MKVTKTEFVTSAVKAIQYPTEALPEFALAGRSNVGKSSLLNCLIGRKNLARTSSKPGKTQLINFYRINDLLYFADVPGYGFANVPKYVRAAWGKMMKTYLTQRQSLKAVIQVVDIRHLPSNDDQNMSHFLQHYHIPIIVVATKADKIPKAKWSSHLQQIGTVLHLSAEDPLLLFSATTTYGKENLWQEIEQRMKRDESQAGTRKDGRA
jgi:GTP-binding protein